MKRRLRLWQIVVMLMATTASVVVAASSPIAANVIRNQNADIQRLPNSMGYGARIGGGKTDRWTIKDLVQLRHIEGVAISDQDRSIAFVVKQGLLKTGDIRYGLYALAPGDQAARKLLEAPYLREVSWHPGTRRWSVLADIGNGVQLYDVDAEGATHPLVVNKATVLSGGNDGAITSPIEGPRQTGVLDYQWAPDGSALWYTKPRLRAPAVQRRITDNGIVYDWGTMHFRDIANEGNPLSGIELHLLVARTGSDRLLQFARSDSMSAALIFNQATTDWTPDSRQIQYVQEETAPNGKRVFSRWELAVKDGTAHKLSSSATSTIETIYAVPMPGTGNFLTVKTEHDGARHLVALSSTGKQIKDYGQVQFRSIGAWSSTTSRWGVDGKHAMLGVGYNDHDGLFFFPRNDADASLAKLTDQFSQCAFISDLSYGACVRENIALPQELVSIVPASAQVKTLVRPNWRVVETIKPLKSTRAHWTNKYGSVSDGYITYPRDYREGKRYPTLVVTHGHDAKNKFAYRGFQSDFPIQVLAETGYVVLSVNDPNVTDKTRAAQDAFITANPGEGTSVAQMQFYKNVDAVAGIEAAVHDAVSRGITDPDRVGIAGYSRGCEVVEFALSHSKLFKAGADGDAGGFNPAGYWLVGTNMYKSLYRTLYGGSAIDKAAIPNYRKYNAVFRAKDFEGPLLQQFAAETAEIGLELNSALRDAHVPSELVFFPHESHIFWQPKHQAGAMRRNLEWFDYWLRGKRSSRAGAAKQYVRWDKMKQEWRTNER